MMDVHPATLRGFLFFRDHVVDHVVDSLVQMAGVLEPIAAPSGLLALVQAYAEGGVSEPEKPRKRTPRVPSNLLYKWIVPIALVVMGLVLLVIIVVAVIGLVNAIR